MSLSSLQLDAFIAVTKAQSFSKAAKNLYITQSALSQRVKHLEVELGVSLLIRDPSGLRLTSVGTKLRRYCQQKELLESNFLEDLTVDEAQGHTGIVRIAGYSSIMRSVIIPALGPFIRDNPKLQCEFIVREMSQLPEALRRGETDFIITDHHLEKLELTARVLGQETYVAITSNKFDEKTDVFLDHDQDDNATEQFFNQQKTKPHYRREFMGEVNNILSAVINGYGSAVMSKHLLEDHMPIKILRRYTPQSRDVVLHYYKQPYYPAVFSEIIKELGKRCNTLL